MNRKKFLTGLIVLPGVAMAKSADNAKPLIIEEVEVLRPSKTPGWHWETDRFFFQYPARTPEQLYKEGFIGGEYGQFLKRYNEFKEEFVVLQEVKPR